MANKARTPGSFVKGQRLVGRAKGTPNKKTVELAEKLASLGCDPVDGMARIVTRSLDCPDCEGTGQAKYSSGLHGPYWDPEKGVKMTCRLCRGSGKEPITPELRGKMLAELAQYILPKRKAVEHSGTVTHTLLEVLKRVALE